MKENPALLQYEQQAFALDYYVELDAQVDKAEDDGIRARWEFGRSLLMERIGRKLPVDRLDEVSEAIGKSRTEIKYRMRFAERFSSEVALGNAIAQYRSWYGIVNEALASIAHLSAEKDEWETPQDLFNALDREFGFTVDVCASPKNAKCERYWTAADDALALDWSGEVCWMNPPYSQIDEWVAKAWQTGHDGGVVVALVPSRTDVGWFWDHARHGEVRFLRGRLAFLDDEDNTGPAPFPSALVVFGPERHPTVRWWEP